MRVCDLLAATGQSAFGFNPGTVTLCAWGALLFVAAVRQVAIWLVGWHRYGRKTTVWEPVGGPFNVLDSRSIRCKQHRHASRDPVDSARHGIQEKLSPDFAVLPASEGARHWSYGVCLGEAVGWFTWMRRCLGLALVRRFSEPSVEPCPYCSILREVPRDRHDIRRRASADWESTQSPS